MPVISSRGNSAAPSSFSKSALALPIILLIAVTAFVLAIVLLTVIACGFNRLVRSRRRAQAEGHEPLQSESIYGFKSFSAVCNSCMILPSILSAFLPKFSCGLPVLTITPADPDIKGHVPLLTNINFDIPTIGRTHGVVGKLTVRMGPSRFLRARPVTPESIAPSPSSFSLSTSPSCDGFRDIPDICAIQILDEPPAVPFASELVFGEMSPDSAHDAGTETMTCIHLLGLPPIEAPEPEEAITDSPSSTDVTSDNSDGLVELYFSPPASDLPLDIGSPTELAHCTVVSETEIALAVWFGEFFGEDCSSKGVPVPSLYAYSRDGSSSNCSLQDISEPASPDPSVDRSLPQAAWEISAGDCNMADEARWDTIGTENGLDAEGNPPCMDLSADLVIHSPTASKPVRFSRSKEQILRRCIAASNGARPESWWRDDLRLLGSIASRKRQAQIFTGFSGKENIV